MAKTPTRRAYEYDHHYGLALGGKTGSKAGPEWKTIGEEALV